MQLRLATTDDAEAIRQIYNLEVTTLDRHVRPGAALARGPAGVARGPLRRPRRRGGDRGRDGLRLRRRCPPGGTARPTPPAWRTRSTSTATTTGRASAGPCSPSWWPPPPRHGFHACMARIVGGHDASDRPPHLVRVRGRGHRARDRPEVRPVARRRAHGTAAGADARDTFPARAPAPSASPSGPRATSRSPPTAAGWRSCAPAARRTR